ncbi:MAG: nucleotidyltransferase domain-containing protein [Candidatus Caenarcaniphilales bacterium]|nr:nucleotidyltransferase domain-containing protein [Candidatus Caenarcaniphilales bacterium]
MKLNLKDEHRQILEKIFQELIPSLEVWAYGSRVSNENLELSSSGSDIDLVIKGHETIEIKTLSKIKEQISDSNIPFMVDIFDWHRIPEEFQKNILKNHYKLK